LSALRSMVIASLLLWTVAAGAAPSADDLARGRTHFEAGQAMYQLGRYAEAAREFSASYALTQKTALILNIGSCYRKLGDLTAAREVFSKFLSEAPAQDPYRPQVVRLLAEIDADLAKQHPVVMAPIEPPPPVVVPPEPVVIAATPPKKSFIRRNWWIIPVSAVVVAGVAVGVYFGARRDASPDCKSTTLGCVNP
jgi:tetratricopeptide (TPR) repeat protein